MLKALILIDFENEWINPDSDYYLGFDIFDVIQRVNKLISYCRANNYKIIFLRHIEEGSQDAFAPWSENIKIISSIDKRQEDIIIDKNTIWALYNTDLPKYLDWVSSVAVCWILTNLCVRKFVEDAYDMWYDISLIKDCCVSFDKQTHDFTIQDLKNTREEINMIDLQDYIW